MGRKKQQSIKFADWLHLNFTPLASPSDWDSRHPEYKKSYYTTDELYKMFKKELKKEPIIKTKKPET